MPIPLKLGLAAGTTLAALALLGKAAHAQTFYTSRAAFDANSIITHTENFSGIAPAGSFQSYRPTNTLTVGGFSFTQTNNTPNADLSVISGTYYGSSSQGYYNLGQGDFLQAGYGNPGIMTLTLPAGTTAFGLDLGTFAGSGGGITALLSNGSSVFLANSFPQVTFFGFTSAAPITTLKLTDVTDGAPNNALNIDTLEAGQAAPVPEASTTVSLALLLALGLGSTVLTVRKKKAAAA